jgi:predicted acyl esterase
MSNQHRATPEQWEHQDHWTREHRSTASCILELRARIEALEAAQQDKLDRLIAQDRAASAEARLGGSLVERVETRAGGDGRAAIREVAKSAKDLRFTTAKALIGWLERDADRG